MEPPDMTEFESAIMLCLWLIAVLALVTDSLLAWLRRRRRRRAWSWYRRY